MRKAAIILAVVVFIVVVMLGSHVFRDWKGPLEKAVAGANRLALAPVWPKDQPPVFELQGEAQIGELVQLIEIDAWRSWASCRCFGDTSLRFYKGQELLTTLNFAHGNSLKWPGGPWRNDAALTEKCQVALCEWFKQKRYAGFEEARQSGLAEKKREKEEDELFASFFPEKVRKLVLGRSWTGNLDADEAAGRKIARIIGDPKAVAVASCRALGVSTCKMRSTTEKERRAQAAAKTVNDNAFLAALEIVKDEPRSLRGAARLFFSEGLGKSLRQDVRIEWAVRLAEVVLTDGHDEDKPFLLRWLSNVADPRVRELLHRVVEGAVGTAFDPADVYGQEPRLQPGALLCLALLGDETILPKVNALLTDVEAEEDRAALEVCLALLGDPAYIKKEHFKLESHNISLAALKAIERFNGAHGMEALVEGGFNHPWAVIQDEAGQTFDLITRQNFASKSRDSYPYKLAEEWWKTNGEAFARQRMQQKSSKR